MKIRAGVINSLRLTIAVDFACSGFTRDERRDSRWRFLNE